MKEFVTAVEDIEAEDAREAKIKALMDEGKTRQEAEDEVEDEDFIEFKLDGRVYRAYKPLDGQLAILMASLGRGQTSDQRLAGIVNLLMSVLRDEDQDHFEARLLSRDRKQRIGLDQLNSIFEYLIEEWYATPTK